MLHTYIFYIIYYIYSWESRDHSRQNSTIIQQINHPANDTVLRPNAVI